MTGKTGESLDILGFSGGVCVRQPAKVPFTKPNVDSVEADAISRIDSGREIDWLKAGEDVPHVLEKFTE